MGIFEFAVSVLIGYFFGCFQTAYIIGRVVRRIDIRTQGSNNAGASNVTMVLGWKYGAITALADIVKAALAVLIVGVIFPSSRELAFVAGASAVLGHIFPFYLGFKGGKGAASLIGMLLAIDFKIAVIAVLTIVIITLIIDYIAIGSIGMFAVLPVATYVFNYPFLCTLIGVGLALLCVYKHQINIKRIIKKEEAGLRKVVKKERK